MTDFMKLHPTTVGSDGLVYRLDGGVHALPIDAFRTGLAGEAAGGMVIVQLQRDRRLSHRSDDTPAQAKAAGDLEQFALTARKAAELGQHLLELAAVLEREESGQKAN